VSKRNHRTILDEDALKDLILKIEAVEVVGFDTLSAGDEPLTASRRLAFAIRRRGGVPAARSRLPSAPTTSTASILRMRSFSASSSRMVRWLRLLTAFGASRS